MIKDRDKVLNINKAVNLYREGKISLGKAVEIAGSNYEEMKKFLAERGTKCHSGSETVEELKREFKAFENWFKNNPQTASAEQK